MWLASEDTDDYDNHDDHDDYDDHDNRDDQVYFPKVFFSSSESLFSKSIFY